jgi:hypothetical protein
MINSDGFMRRCVVLQGNVIMPALVSGDRRKQTNVSQITNTVRSVETYGLYSVLTFSVTAGCS